MALIGAFTKQPREIIPVDISYTGVIGGRAASAVMPTVEVPSGMTIAGQVVSGSTVQIYVAGGTTGSSYRWVVLTDILIGGLTTRVEDEFDVVVLEV